MPQMLGLRSLLERQPPEQRDDTLRVWRIAVIVTVAIGLSKHLPIGASIAGLAVAAAQLMIPLRYALTSKDGDDGIGYSAAGLGRDLPMVIGIFLLTSVPFWFAHEAWWTWLGQADGSGSRLAVPEGDLAPFMVASGWISPTISAPIAMLELIAIHTIGVALPEELFYRGFLQPKLCQSFADRPIGAGFVWNPGIAVAAALFAAAHFLGEYNPARLGPFFPALLFGLLRRRSGSIASAVLLHAAFNVLGAMLFAGLAPR